MFQNPYFIAAIFLTVVLILVFIRGLFSEATPENFQKQYEKLDDEGKEKITKILDKMFEDQALKKEARQRKWAKIISSNRWLFVVFMFTAHKMFMTPDEKEKFKQDLIKKFPHLRNAIDNRKWPFK